MERQSWSHHEVGDVANGQRLDADGVWRPVAPTLREPTSPGTPLWRIGDTASGYRLDLDEVWRPIGSKPTRRWLTRPLGVLGIVIVALISLGTIVATARSGPGSKAEGTATQATESRPSQPRSSQPDSSDPVATTGREHRGSSSSARLTPTPRQKTQLVTRIVDGDTLELGNGKTVRLVGIDTPERGECGFEEASSSLASLVLGGRVTLSISDEDTDRYGRLLRYVNAGEMDAGLRQIKSGWAIARYDSRDGYGYHPRQPLYIATDNKVPQRGCAQAQTPKSPQPTPGRWGNCMIGYSPCLPAVADLDCSEIGHPVTVTGSDPYRLDADGDGIGCDS